MSFESFWSTDNSETAYITEEFQVSRAVLSPGLIGNNLLAASFRRVEEVTTKLFKNVGHENCAAKRPEYAQISRRDSWRSKYLYESNATNDCIALTLPLSFGPHIFEQVIAIVYFIALFQVLRCATFIFINLSQIKE